MTEDESTRTDITVPSDTYVSQEDKPTHVTVIKGHVKEDWPAVALGEGVSLIVCKVRANVRSQTATDAWTIGRSSNCAISIDDDSVSRSHARLTRDQDDRYFVEDLNSSNGTWLGGLLLTEPTQLSNNDQLSVGDIRAVFTKLGDEPRTEDAIARIPLDTWFLATMKAIADDEPTEIVLVRLNTLQETNRTRGYEVGDKHLQALVDAMAEVSLWTTRIRGGELACMVRAGGDANGQAVVDAIRPLRVDGERLNWRAQILDDTTLVALANRKALAKLIDDTFAAMPRGSQLPAPMAIGRASVTAKTSQFERVFAMNRAIELDLKFFGALLIGSLRDEEPDGVAAVIERFGYQRGRTKKLTMGAWLGTLRELAKLAVDGRDATAPLARLFVSKSGKSSGTLKALNEVLQDRNEKVVHAAGKSEGGYDDEEARLVEALRLHEEAIRDFSDWELIAPSGLKFTPAGQMAYDVRLLHGAGLENPVQQRLLEERLVNDWCYFTDGETVLPLIPVFFLSTIGGRVELCAADELEFDPQRNVRGRGLVTDNESRHQLPLSVAFPELQTRFS